MKKHQIFALGVITGLTGVWPFLSPTSYVPLVIYLGWKSFLIFPAIIAFLSAATVFVFKDAEITLDSFVEKHIKNKRLKEKFKKLFNGGKIVALVASAFLFSPFIIPVLTKICIKNEKRVYFFAIGLNTVMTIIWIGVYLGIFEVSKSMFLKLN